VVNGQRCTEKVGQTEALRALILFGLIAPRAIKVVARSTTEVTDETVRTDETVTEASD
jgi:hypothetical protein